MAKAENLEQDPVPDPFVDNGIVIDLNQYHTDSTIGGYARTGFDIDGNLYFFSLTQKY